MNMDSVFATQLMIMLSFGMNLKTSLLLSRLLISLMLLVLNLPGFMLTIMVTAIKLKVPMLVVLNSRPSLLNTELMPNGDNVLLTRTENADNGKDTKFADRILLRWLMVITGILLLIKTVRKCASKWVEKCWI